MEKIKELFAKHPYLASGGAIAIFILFYYLFSRSSSSSGTAYTSGGTDAQTSAANTAAQIEQLRSQTQLGLATIQAGTATEQINAAHDVALLQTNAQLEALKSNNETQLGLAQVQAGQNEATSKALEDIVTAQYTSAAQRTHDAYAYLSTISTNQTAVQQAALAAKTAQDKAVISALSGVNNSALRAGVLSTITTGSSAPAVASQNGVATTTVSGQNQVSSIISSALSALF